VIALLPGALARTAALTVLGFVLMAAFAPLIAPHDPNATDLFRRLQPPGWMEDGDWAYPLGCDALGRDILTRIIYGARISIVIGVVVVLLATAIGVMAGLAAGYLRRRPKTTESREIARHRIRRGRFRRGPVPSRLPG